MFDIDINTLPSGVLTVKVKSPEKLFFEGKALALTSINEIGEFDVLPFHSNFISIIKDFIRIHQNNQSPKELKIDRAVLQASSNTITVYLGIGTGI